MLHRGISKVLRVSAALAIVSAPMAWATSSASASGVFSNTASIGLQNPSSSSAQAATVYPSTISVSGQSGTISSVAVTLSGINYSFSQDIGALLVGPTGRALSLFTAVGSNTQSTATSGLNVTLDDSASQTFPYNTALPTSGSVTMKPDDISTDFAGFSYDQYPFPAPTSFGEAAPTGMATLGSTFDGTNPNGTWSLHVTTNTEGDGTGSISGGWLLDITTAATLSATTTSLTSSQNPSFTSAPDSSVTLTATVTSSGGPVTSGTVDFTDGGTTISGCGAVTLNGSGQAACTTSFSGEGDHALQAVYSGTASFAVSDASTTQEVDNHTTVVAPNEFANIGAVALNNPTSSSPQPATPYPSHIYTSDLGPVTGLTVTLDGVSYPFSQDLDALLVGPTGNSIVLLSNVGPSSGVTHASDVTVTFDDAATSAIPQFTPLGSPGSSVTTKPVDYVGTDTDSFPAPAPAGPYGTPAPKGSATFGGTFDGTNPNGTWSLYVVTDGRGRRYRLSSGWLEHRLCRREPDRVLQLDRSDDRRCRQHLCCQRLSYIDAAGQLLDRRQLHTGRLLGQLDRPRQFPRRREVRGGRQPERRREL